MILVGPVIEPQSLHPISAWLVRGLTPLARSIDNGRDSMRHFVIGNAGGSFTVARMVLRSLRQLAEPRPMTPELTSVRLLALACAACLLVLTACLPGEPYPSGYLLRDGDTVALNLVTCGKKASFHRASLYLASAFDEYNFRFRGQPLWAVQAISATPMIIIGTNNEPGLRLIRPLRTRLRPDTAYLVSYTSTLDEWRVPMRLDDLKPGMASSGLGNTDASEITKKRNQFGCVR